MRFLQRGKHKHENLFIWSVLLGFPENSDLRYTALHPLRYFYNLCSYSNNPAYCSMTIFISKCKEVYTCHQFTGTLKFTTGQRRNTRIFAHPSVWYNQPPTQATHSPEHIARLHISSCSSCSSNYIDIGLNRVTLQVIFISITQVCESSSATRSTPPPCSYITQYPTLTFR